MSNWSVQRSSLTEALKNTSRPGTDGTQTGFIENWQAGLSTTIDQDLSISKSIMNAPRRQRNDNITKAIQEGKIPHDIVGNYRTNHGRMPGIDHDGLAKWGNENGLDFLTDEQIDEDIKSDVQSRQAMQSDISSRAGIGGTIGEFVGRMHAGVALDPINVAASLPTAGAAATVWKTITNAAKVGVATNIIAETAIQPLIYEWKQEMGIDYTFGDVATSMALSAIMGGAISGSAAGLGKVVTNARIKARKTSDPDEAEALLEIADVFEQMEVEARNAPDGTLSPQAVDKIISERYIQVAEGVYDTPAGIAARADMEKWQRGVAEYDARIEELNTTTGQYVQTAPGVYEFAPTQKVYVEVKKGVYELQTKQEALGLEQKALVEEKPKPDTEPGVEPEVPTTIDVEALPAEAQVVPMNPKAKAKWEATQKFEMEQHEKFMNQIMGDGRTYAEGLGIKTGTMNKLKAFDICKRGG